MKTSVWLQLFAVAIFALLQFQCTGTVDPVYDTANAYYATSFENEKDLAGWQGISTAELRSDAAPGYGSKSVFISGGCVIPHASLVLPPPGAAKNVRIGFYAKLLSSSGVCEMVVGSDYHGAKYISVSDSNWTFYRSDEIIHWPADSTLTIWLNSGGFTGGAMLVDGLRVKESK